MKVTSSHRKLSKVLLIAGIVGFIGSIIAPIFILLSIYGAVNNTGFGGCATSCTDNLNGKQTAIQIDIIVSLIAIAAIIIGSILLHYSKPKPKSVV